MKPIRVLIVEDETIVAGISTSVSWTPGKKWRVLSTGGKVKHWPWWQVLCGISPQLVDQTIPP